MSASKGDPKVVAKGSTSFTRHNTVPFAGLSVARTAQRSKRNTLVGRSRPNGQPGANEVYEPAHRLRANNVPEPATVVARRARRGSMAERAKGQCSSMSPSLDDVEYFVQKSTRSASGDEVSLMNQNQVLNILRQLYHDVVVPLCNKFGLRDEKCDRFRLFEKKCQVRRPGVAQRFSHVVRRYSIQGMRKDKSSVVTIRLRVRVHPTEGDPQREFLSIGTQIAVLIHELCHLKFMTHCKNFMFLLRDMFQEATRLGVFKPGEMTNQIPSAAPWENEIVRTGGGVDTQTLLTLFREHCAEAGAPVAKKQSKSNKRTKAFAVQSKSRSLNAPRQSCNAAVKRCTNNAKLTRSDVKDTLGENSGKCVW
eukprot:TRINITY_DN67506_c0_g1_i1.p1 TRINITY_DN67506_c0_g1~~TRINITY_DN67506_c0_g1_i1.p1  ORF type:complete len:365 (-),score=30.96 TRINITY_DN67506_c0_g1_i1:35-1129(-)